MSVLEAIRTISEVAIEDLPQPKANYILVKMRKVDEKIGSLFVPESRLSDENHATPLADVILMGPECYLETSYPKGPLCKVGDTILMAPYSGIRVLVGTEAEAYEYRLISDHIVAATVSKPSLIRRNL